MTANKKPARRARGPQPTSWSAEHNEIVRAAAAGSHRRSEKRLPFREATRKNARQALSFWIGYIERTHPGLLRLPFAASVTMERVNQFKDNLAETNAPRSVFDLLERIELLLKRAGRANEAAIFATVAGISPPRPRTMPPDADAACAHAIAADLFSECIREIKTLGHGRRARSRARAAAGEAMTALKIEILTVLPLRIGNLLNLRLGDSLVIRDGTAIVSILGAEMKSGEPLYATLGAGVTEDIQRYLEEVRPILATPDSEPFVFLSPRGLPLPYITAYQRIVRHSTAWIGERIPPHRFRHMVSVWSRGHEDLGAEVAARSAQHMSLRTNERYYAAPRTAYGLGAWRKILADD